MVNTRAIITHEDLKRYSSEMLDLLEREKIDDIEGLQKRVGESFVASDGIIQLEARPSGSKIIATDVALTMSYIIEGKGIPLEIRLNHNSAYSRIILKSQDRIEDYSPIGFDSVGSNVIQSKIGDYSFELIKEELKRVAK